MSDLKISSNYEAAFKKLKEFSSLPVQEERDVSGIIQAFEFTFELAWKTLQKVLIKEGFEPRGPKHCIELALKHGHIQFQDEEIWKEMLADRNMTVHTYREEIANLVLSNIINKYIVTFESLLQFFKENY
jgi:nucleotidyltransferase substrate binding protein (TIGR01987 family)